MKMSYFRGSNIVTIQPRHRARHFPALGKVEAYWEALRNGRLMPTRADVDPRGISDVLEFAFMLERVAPGVARFRLAGMHINDMMDMEVRGMPVTAMMQPEAREDMMRVLNDVLDAPAVTRLTMVSDKGYGRPLLDAQMILLPLRDTEGHPARILGALQSRGEIGRGPRRLRIRDIEPRQILADPSFSPAPLPEPEKRTENRPVAKPQPLRQRGHLTLVYDSEA